MLTIENGIWKGNKYEGKFKNEKFHGEGTYSWSDGRKFIGSWVNGNKIGWGELFLPDGKKYDGRWKDDKIWNAKLYDKDGNVIKVFVKGVKTQD